MTVQQHKSKIRELDKKRWMVRFLILSAVAVVLVIKLYLTLFVMDRLLGIYSFLTTFILFNILTFAWLRYRDPYFKAKDTDLSDVKPPLISIVVPVKNEEDKSTGFFAVYGHGPGDHRGRRQRRRRWR